MTTSEHSPLSPFDEYPIHQVGQPLRAVATTDPRAYERYWFTAQDAHQELFVVVGLGFYPNLGTADAYAIVVHGQRHTTVRAHRMLGDDRSIIRTGPIAAEMVEPFREWRLTVDDNPQAIRVDLRWRDTKRPVFQRLGGNGMQWTVNGRPSFEVFGYESFGRVDGTVSVGDVHLSLAADRTKGSRDHHWGVRDGVGGPGHALEQPNWSHCGQWVEFGDWSIWGSRALYNLGDETKPGASVVEAFEHRLQFHPVTKHLVGGVIRTRFPGGEVKTIRYRQVGDVVAYLRCGMYMGPTGLGSPEENYFHGTFEGAGPGAAERVGGETYDLSDPITRTRIAGFDDHLVIAECDGERTVGILECKNPLLYEMCAAGIRGFGLLADDEA